MNLSLQEKYNADLKIKDVESQQYLGHPLEDIIHVDFCIITAHWRVVFVRRQNTKTMVKQNL